MYILFHTFINCCDIWLSLSQDQVGRKHPEVEKLEGIFKAIDDGGDGMITEERLTCLGDFGPTSDRTCGWTETETTTDYWVGLRDLPKI